MTSLRDTILLTAVDVADAGRGDVSAVALVLASWRRDPLRCGLPGHPEHAHSNAVLSKLSGSAGLCGRGWLARVSVGTYVVTRRGRIRADSAGASRRTKPKASTGGVRGRHTPRPEPLRVGDQSLVVALARDPRLTDALRPGRRTSPATAAILWGHQATEAGVRDIGERLARVVAAHAGTPGLPPLAVCRALLGLHLNLSALRAREVAA